MKRLNSQDGFGAVEVLLILVVVACIGIAGWYVWQRSNKHNVVTSNASVSKPAVKKPAVAPSVAATADPNLFIVNNPVDLSQIGSISKFRSCAGHDYSGYDTSGVLEMNRSMKHYFEPTSSLASSVGQVKVYAPFNGTIYAYQPDQVSRGEKLTLLNSAGTWQLTVFHVDLNSGLQPGSNITAGQLLGYAHIQGGQDFDIALQAWPIPLTVTLPTETMSSAQRQQSMMQYGMQHGLSQSDMMKQAAYDSIFNHMTSAVLSQYSSKGVMPTNIIISAAYRDANACNFNVFSPSDFVQL